LNNIIYMFKQLPKYNQQKRFKYRRSIIKALLFIS
jgi:hypothetical protein